MAFIQHYWYWWLLLAVIFALLTFLQLVVVQEDRKSSDSEDTESNTGTKYGITKGVPLALALLSVTLTFLILFIAATAKGF